ncbi:MAG: tetratricopeptide repeat protein, partial [Pseudomonadales bacterium]|nr:tetratricopeptide repeat protein [Pseudomonadales bacterium]
FKQAETSFNEALRIDPAFVAASAGKAELLEWQGEYSQGMSLLQPLLAAQTDDPAVLTVYARLLRRTGDAGKGMDVLQPLAESGRVSGAPLRQVRFTLGDLSDQLRRYDEAFCWYKLARQYRPNTFSAAAHRRFIDDLLLRFDSKSTQQLNRSGNNSTQPIFIVGMPRSGTSLTEQILAAHPDVFAAGERSHIGRIVQQIAPLRNPTRAVLARHAHAYLNGLGDSSRAAQRFTDKMPLNFLYLGWIAQLFPKARIVWCRRDPRDTGLSCFTTNFIDPALAFSDELEDIALYSNSCVELMAHWQNTLDLTIFELQYESLVREPESILRELLSVLEL